MMKEVITTWRFDVPWQLNPRLRDKLSFFLKKSLLNRIKFFNIILKSSDVICYVEKTISRHLFGDPDDRSYSW